MTQPRFIDITLCLVSSLWGILRATIVGDDGTHDRSGAKTPGSIPKRWSSRVAQIVSELRDVARNVASVGVPPDW